MNQILDLAEKLMLFDPNYTYDETGDTVMEDDEGEGWGSDFEDDNVGNQDDDDTTWKVRRASVKLLESITSSRPDLLRSVYQRFARVLVMRFKERDENVKCNILEAFRTLLKSAILSEQHQGIDYQLQMQPSLVRARSSIDELSDIVPEIIKELVKQFRASKSNRVKAAVMNTLAQLAHVMNARIGPYFNTMLPEFQKIMEDPTGYDLILDVLVILRRLFKGPDANM